MDMNNVAKILYRFMKRKVQNNVDAKDLNHIPTFFSHNIKNHWRLTLTEENAFEVKQNERCNCTDCRSLFKTIQEYFQEKTSQEKPIYLERPDVSREPVAILLRMCLDYKGTFSKRIQDGDLKILCRVLEGCKLFEPGNVDEVMILFYSIFLTNNY
jgi:hypothetical protein